MALLMFRTFGVIIVSFIVLIMYVLHRKKNGKFIKRKAVNEEEKIKYQKWEKIINVMAVVGLLILGIFITVPCCLDIPYLLSNNLVEVTGEVTQGAMSGENSNSERRIHINLNEYYVIGCGRGANLRDEQMSIAYRRDRINLISMETWWLSQTPDVPGSRYEEQSSCPRTATEAVFEDIKSGKVFRFINTHLDHIGEQAREKGLTQILNQLKQERFWKDIPVILCGDFNAEPNAPEMEIISRDSSFNNLTKDIGITFHGYYKNDPNDPPCSIDYIVLKGDWQCETVYKWTDEENGIYLSDHYPVCAVINLVQQQNHCTDEVS